MAFRGRRRFPRRRFAKRRAGGGRWGDAGRKGGIIRARREWTGWYEFPECGGLEQGFISSSDECWSVGHVQILPIGGIAGDDTESTLVAFRGSVQPWVHARQDDLGAIPEAQATGAGWGLQLVPYRSGTAGTQANPRSWEDCDNSDWLVRKYFPAASMCTTKIVGEISPGVQGSLMLCGDPDSRILEITSRKVDWSEWQLFMTFAYPASEDETEWFWRVEGRLLEAYVGGQSVLG